MSRQLPHTARDDEAPADRVAGHLWAARREIDAVFEDGHSARNPELVAAFLNAAAIGSAVSAGRETSRNARQLAARVSRETNETLLKLKPRIFG
jgi:hypothetical protein